MPSHNCNLVNLIACEVWVIGNSDDRGSDDRGSTVIRMIRAQFGLTNS